MFDVSDIVSELTKEKEGIVKSTKKLFGNIVDSIINDEEVDPKKCLPINKEIINATITATNNFIARIADCALNEEAFDGSKLDIAMVVAFQMIVEDFGLLNRLIKIRDDLGDADLRRGNKPLNDMAFFKLLEDAFYKQYNRFMDECVKDSEDSYCDYEEIE